MGSIDLAKFRRLTGHDLVFKNEQAYKDGESYQASH